METYCIQIEIFSMKKKLSRILQIWQEKANKKFDEKNIQMKINDMEVNHMMDQSLETVWKFLYNYFQIFGFFSFF